MVARERSAGCSSGSRRQLESKGSIEGGSFDPPGSDQRGLPQLGFVKLLPQLARIAAPYGPALERRTRYRSFRALREVRVEVRHPKCRPLHTPRGPRECGPRNAGAAARRAAVPRPLPLALAAQKYSLRLEGSMTFMWQAPVAPNKLTCVLGILLNSLQLSELECPMECPTWRDFGLDDEYLESFCKAEGRANELRLDF